MLSLRIEYLLGRAVAADASNPGRAEWPPHPARLYSALVAALHARGNEPTERMALLWLESQGPPALSFAEAQPGTSHTVFVPVNDGKDDKKYPPRKHQSMPRFRIRQPRQMPRIGLGPESSAVWMTWTSDSGEHRPALEELAQSIPYLGHSSSLVSICIAADAPPPTHVPAEEGELYLRIPEPGRLAVLEAAHGRTSGGSRLQAPAAMSVAYTEVSIQTGRPFIQGQHPILIPYRLRGPAIGFRHQDAVVESVRAAVLGAWGRRHGVDAIPEAISGHIASGAPSSTPHLAVAPLGNVGHRNADGRIGGVALLLPDPVLRRELERVVDSIGPVGIRGRQMDLILIPPWERTSAPGYLRTRTYLTRSKTWATVAPAVLARVPRKGRPIESIAAHACEQAGLPEPVEISASHVSVWRGAPTIREVGRREKLVKGRYMTHLVVRWTEPVRGPVLLGCGRHWGYGLCRPLHDAQETAA